MKINIRSYLEFSIFNFRAAGTLTLASLENAAETQTTLILGQQATCQPTTVAALTKWASPHF